MSLKNDENFKRLLSPGVLKLRELFDSHGFELRIAGGAPRDLLLSILPNDLDFATTATPDQMLNMFSTEEIRMVNPNGIKHGTITARIFEENYEITTLRIDRVTDGRHAEVEFTTDWRVDANRRDLTINSMFLTFQGEIIDFFNGQDDLHNRCVKFVGNPADRIQEDYLRILRYFRFYSRVCLSGHNHDLSHLEAISQNAEGLKGISGERIWVEMHKILAQRFNFEYLDHAYKLGFAKYIGLPDKGLEGRTDNYQRISENKHASVMTKIACLADTPEDIIEMDKRLKWSKPEFSLAMFLLTQRNVLTSESVNLPNMAPEEKLEYYKKLKARVKFNLFGFNETHKRVTNYDMNWVDQLAIFMNENPDFVEEIIEFSVPKSPVPPPTALTNEHGVRAGPLLGQLSNRLKRQWIESVFTATKEDIVQSIQTIKSEYIAQNKMDKDGNFIKPKKRSRKKSREN